jgi:hydroxymethylpyrimidine/phosphomethylpyrimidine kinase
VAEQIRLLFSAFPIAAIKTGMLHSRAILHCVCDVLDECAGGSEKRPPLVVDPVMVATSGNPLLHEDAVEAYCKRLFPMATLVTPNLDETRTLLGREVTTVEEMRQAGSELVARYGTAFLLKGGHLREPVATDLLFAEGDVAEFRAPFVPGVATHGMGCTYSAAIAAGLGRGLSLRESVREAKRFITHAVTHFLRWEKDGHFTDALHHFARTNR